MFYDSHNKTRGQEEILRASAYNINKNAEDFWASRPPM
jgi:hypothetical protein